MTANIKTYKIWDVETGIKSLYKRKGTPFYKQNAVIASGFKVQGALTSSYDYAREGLSGLWFRKLLLDTSFLVGFNIKFDLLHALQDPANYEAWVDYVDKGGQVWDCQLAEYLLHGMSQENQILSLDETAPRYGGHVKNDAIKALWQAGIETADIDKDMLLEYLVGAEGSDKDQGDIGNTELIFLGQVKALRARGSLQSVLLNMGALLYTIEAEHNGVYIDKALGMEQAVELKAEVEALLADLDGYLPADLPFEFKWTSRFHLSALVFGGTVNYKAKAPILDDAGNQTYSQKEELHYMLVNGDTTPLPPGEDPDIGVMAYVTNKSGKNAGEFKTKKVKSNDYDKPRTKITDFQYTFPGVTEPEDEWKSSTPGVWSVASAVIEALGERDIPFLQALADRAAKQKDLGTYYYTKDEDSGEEKGMLTMVGPDGLLHHQLHMNRTVTGRLSSSDPNLQNVSGGQKSKVKTVFTSRYNDGFIIQSDFTSLEIYVQAMLTGDENLILDLIKGLDMHCVRAWQAWGSKEGLTYEQVLEYAVHYGDRDDLTDEQKALHKKWKYKRKNAKVFSFQRAYGAGAAKIAKTTGMSIEEVEALIAAEDERYPRTAKFYAELTDTIKRNRVPTTRFCQHPDVPGMQCQLGRSHYFTPDKKMYSYSESPSPAFIARKPASQGGTPQSFSPTEIKNYVVQGTGGEWAKAAMYLSVRAFYRVKNFEGLAVLVNQVHDAEYVDAAASVANKAAALLHACMEEASVYMDYWFKWELPLGVPTDTKYGRNMGEENSMPDGHRDMVNGYREWVRSNFINNHQPAFLRAA